MAATRVSTQVLRSVAEQVEQNVNQYVGYVNDLYTSGNELDSLWDGDANQKFNAQLQNDKPKFDAMQTVLTKYVQTLRENADAYDKAEADAEGIVQTNKTRKA
ncbi:MAG: WXG100 family type VII secretion target [Oscillospiraceae bacterium]|jgi:WXG100 family type VII secretion target|nr:WXG100 family type VII secretion target [Oscillospiraceae bacterium]